MIQEMHYKEQVILTYTVYYPYLSSAYNLLILEQINAYYRTKAMMYINKEIKNLYLQAMVDYEYALANQFPFRQYEVYADFTVTYNRDCILSFYFDRYVYTGGAHGSTVRSSDSWNLACSRPLSIADLFPAGTDIREYYIMEIIKQIKNEPQNEIMMYFDDYENLVRQNLNMNNFYLTDEGVVIYFQQYEIAPYASGIPEFLIPYSADGAALPEYC
ncbi:MAG TPA: DUF3298 and DUF4163 domain-containing protein [Mobilitalea sp.]|nr:DUF3298 and DUF4163 domain-containing protein [Mobilitalea sp.]